MSEEQEEKQCPNCGETIKASAKKCRFCGTWLNVENNNKSEEVKQTISCPSCGEEILSTAKKCKHCGEYIYKNNNTDCKIFIGKQPLPEEYKHFNWGAFWFTSIWGIGNDTWIAFLEYAIQLYSIIPFLGWSTGPLLWIGFKIYLGIKGNELAWKNREWKSLEAFDKRQHNWGMWAGIIFGLTCLFIILYVVIFAGIIASIGESYR